MSKMQICVTRTDNPIRVNGSGDVLRLSVDAKCHVGPTGMLDRKVTMILSPDEALALAVDLMGKLPALMLKDKSPVEKLESYCRMLRA